MSLILNFKGKEAVLLSFRMVSVFAWRDGEKREVLRDCRRPDQEFDRVLSECKSDASLLELLRLVLKHSWTYRPVRVDPKDICCGDWIEVAQDECLTSRLALASRTVC
jgi:hypothetical protein